MLDLSLVVLPLDLPDSSLKLRTKYPRKDGVLAGLDPCLLGALVLWTQPGCRQSFQSSEKVIEFGKYLIELSYTGSFPRYIVDASDVSLHGPRGLQVE